MSSARVGEEDGFTLVEVLVALSILGVAGVALLGGLQLSAWTANAHRAHASAGNSTIVVAEDLRRQNYVACHASAGGSPPYTVPASGLNTVSLKTVDVLDPGTGQFHPWWNGSSYSPCPSFGDSKVQRLTIRVVTPDGRGNEETQIIKRNPA